jgi:hypothetical protein
MSDYCQYQVVHPDDRPLGGLTVYDPAGVIAGIRWIECGDFVEYTGPGNPPSKFCPYHNRLAEDIDRRIKEQRAKEKPVFNTELNPDGPFKVHKLNERGMLRANVIAGAFNQLLDLVRNNARPEPPYKISVSDPCGQGYPASNTEELRQFIFKLQEASFYAKRAIAVLPENQQ